MTICGNWNLRSKHTTCDWWKFWKGFSGCFDFESCISRKTVVSSSTCSYESRRVRKCQSTWFSDFPSLVHDSNRHETYCKFCAEFSALADKSSPLLNGTSGFRRATLQAHLHKQDASQVLRGTSCKENPNATPLGRALRSMNSQTHEKLRTLFNNTNLT